MENLPGVKPNALLLMIARMGIVEIGEEGEVEKEQGGMEGEIEAEGEVEQWEEEQAPITQGANQVVKLSIHENISNRISDGK